MILFLVLFFIITAINGISVGFAKSLFTHFVGLLLVYFVLLVLLYTACLEEWERWQVVKQAQCR